MGREVKRVALDFNWPLHKVWKGFINDHPGPTNCASCSGSGSSPTARVLKDKWYGNVPFTPEENGSVPLTIEHPAVRKFATKNTLQSHFTSLYGFDDGIKMYWDLVKEEKDIEFLRSHLLFEASIRLEAMRLIEMWNGQWSHHLNRNDVKALLDGGRLTEFTGCPRTEEQKSEYERIEAANQANRDNPVEGYEYVWFNNGYIPTPQDVNDWAILSFGHDAINQWICVKARCEYMGVSSKCDVCDGEGCIWNSEEAKTYYDAWKQEDPPAVEGWQLWETVSEGSPITPVFATPEKLAKYLVTTGNDTSVTKGTTYEQWMGMIQVGWAPTGISNGDGFKDGVQATGDMYIQGNV